MRSLQSQTASASHASARLPSINTHSTAKPPPTQDDLETIPDIVPFSNFNYVSTRHAGRISSVSVCSRKPLIATCSNDLEDSSVRIWNYRTRQCILHKYFDGLQNPNSVSLHPSGNEIIVGFDDNVKVYHLCSEIIKQASQIQVKQMIHVFKADADGFVQDKLIMSQDNVRLVKFSPDGGMFAVVTGKCVQLFDTYGSQVNGQPKRVTVLSGHAQMITNLTWTGDSLGLLTTDAGGAVYEWAAGKPDRIRESLLGRVNISAVGTSLNGGCLIATGGGLREKKKEELLKRKKKQGTSVSLNAAGRVTLFNPQARQAIQKNRKRSLLFKKQHSALMKAKSVAKLSNSIGGGEDGGDATQQSSGQSGINREEGPLSSLVGWAKDVESSRKVSLNLVGRVTCIVCTTNDDYQHDKTNYAFACTSDGRIITVEWANATGYKAGELKVDEEDEDAKFDKDGKLVEKNKR